MTGRPFAVVALLVAAAVPALAQKVTPGLWETTMQTKSGQLDAANAQMKDQLAKMPPEQRKMVEEMMAKQGVGMGGKPSTVRYCISKEQAEKGDVAQDQNRGSCKRDITDRSASSLRFKFACTDPPSSGSGEIKFSSDKAYTMKMVVDTQMQGRPERMEMQHDSRWVGADCGAAQPKK